MRKTKRLILLGMTLILFTKTFSQLSGQGKGGALERPKLVVGIVVDQMRWDYLYRYYDRYGDGGFKRMMNNGFMVENTYIDYVPTVTGIGHTSIFTGTVPSVHGIAGNTFVDESTRKIVYCVEDSKVHPIGSESIAAQMSPHRLLVTTLGDELRLATNFRSKVMGIALKDRSAILSAGRSANAAYWFDVESNRWVTSSWYVNQLPKWVHDENQRKPLEQLAKKGWKTLYPINTYVQSSQDDAPYEGALPGATSATFPLNTEAMISKYGAEPLLNTYLGNELTLSFAKKAIENESFGMDEITDLVTISFSSTDWVGHRFGPNSIEAEDTFLRLDGQLKDLFDYLDSKVGKDSYLVFLTADHGAAHNINFLKDHRISANGWGTGEVLESLNKHLQLKFGVERLVDNLLYYQVHFDEERIEVHNLSRENVILESIKFLGEMPGVHYAVSMENVKTAAIPNRLIQRIVNGYHRKRSGSIQIIVEPGWYYKKKVPITGTDHSSWNPYDSHIPLLFMGFGIKHGTTNDVYHITDISPTISALLGIQEPNGNLGRPIRQLFE